MSAGRVIAALGIGLSASVFLWFAAPYNNFILGNAFISDDFMPVGAVGLVLLLVLVVNPILHRIAPRLRLTFGQLALVFGILLAASITPGQGGLRHTLYPIGATPHLVSQNQRLSEAYETLDPPSALFPEPLGYGIDVSASADFLDELPAGESIPWRKWRGPLLAWGAFFVPYWLMLTALALIVLPYWREEERQPFPLLEAQRALIEQADGGALPPAMRSSLFWIGFGTVTFLHLLQGLEQYFPGRVPVIDLTIDLSAHFTEGPSRYLPHYIRHNQIHFLFLGIAYFMPNRVGMSIWFFQVVYALYLMLGTAYTPAFNAQVVFDHRLGAWIGVPLCILWFGRRHWRSVARAVVRPAKNDAERRKKIGGIGLLAGAIGVWCWLLWVGVPPLWAVGLVGILFLFALGMTRIVAETGVPLMAPNSPFVSTLVNLIPLEWKTAAGVYFSGIVGLVAGHLNRVCATTMLCHALGLDGKATPRRHIRLAGLFLGVILLSVVVGGAIQLALAYRHAESLNLTRRVMGAGGEGYFRWLAEGPLHQFLDGRTGARSYNQAGHILFGGLLAAGLLALCHRSPGWPIHPVALMFVGNWYAHRIWFSVLLGWGLKVAMLKYGGGRGYRAGRGLFLGIMVGEVAAVVCWVLVAAIVAAAGGEYRVVRILPF